ncbi:DsbC family protein [Chitinibacter bivalviorum]|uniref:Thiol:disulfide interchange protein n=1 Tax=Chitinibacter bivalviorum TaxID=2739434 RepID=A0A7H9BDX5_9NEIS|nr:DsbC family protein [Chitinibacter bivalviorum]QLG86765.1 DsbC family protein [Chitinibacter bivalviorum]
MKHLARLMMAAGLFTMVACTAQADTPPKDLKATLSKKLGRPVDAVNPTPVKGIYEVVMGKRQIIYTDAKGEYAFVGEMVDIAKKESLTEKRIAEMMTTDFSKLPLADAVKIVRGDGSRKLVVFTDPDCPFCKRLEQQSLAGIDNITIYNFLMPLPGLHPDAERKSKLIWCAGADQTTAWKNWFFDAKLPEGTGECENPVQRNMALGESLGISGTPALIFADGQIVSGAIPKEQIEELLNKAKAKK